jgi:beta-mannosidase
LYWQLEDIWVAPTWSSIEYDGRWKILHYAAKDVYEPVIIAPHFNISTGDLSVWVTSDLWESVSASAVFEWYDWSGSKLDANTTSAVNFAVGAINSTQVLKTSTKEALGGRNDPRNAILKMSVEASGRLPNSNNTRTFRHEAWFHASSLKDALLVDPGLELKYSNRTQNFTVRATEGVAAWVWLEHGPGILGNFGSNAFWLNCGESREVEFRVKNDTTGGRWIDEVTVQSLWNQTLKE